MSVSQASQPNVFVVILNWNRCDETIECIESVLQSEYENFRIVVVDNGSSDSSVELMRSWAATKKSVQIVVYDQSTGQDGGADEDERRLANLSDCQAIIVIASKRNWGFAGGCNLGVAYALKRDAEYVFFLNNDARVAPKTIDSLITVAQKADAALVGACVWDETGTRVLNVGRQWPAPMFGRLGRPDHSAGSEFWLADTLDGCAMLIGREVLMDRQVSCGFFFDPRFFLYWEDTDLCLFGRSRGYKCVVARDANVRHGVGHSSGGMYNPRSYYYLTRNRRFMARRWLKGRWCVLFHLYYMPWGMLNGLRWFVRGKTDVAHAIVTGLVDGYRGVSGERPSRQVPR